jgi:hypothetical protein
MLDPMVYVVFDDGAKLIVPLFMIGAFNDPTPLSNIAVLRLPMVIELKLPELVEIGATPDDQFEFNDQLPLVAVKMALTLLITALTAVLLTV